MTNKKLVASKKSWHKYTKPPKQKAMIEYLVLSPLFAIKAIRDAIYNLSNIAMPVSNDPSTMRRLLTRQLAW